MNKYFVLGMFLLLGTSLTVNFYLLEKYNNQLQQKKRVLELMEKRNNTVSLAKESLYTDSITNAVNDWLGYGTSNE